MSYHTKKNTVGETYKLRIIEEMASENKEQD